MPRPQRSRITGEDGSQRTLASGPDAYDCITMPQANAAAPGVLVLGLGPVPADVMAVVERLMAGRGHSIRDNADTTGPAPCGTDGDILRGHNAHFAHLAHLAETSSPSPQATAPRHTAPTTGDDPTLPIGDDGRAATSATARIIYIECDAFAAVMPPAWHAAIPGHWLRAHPDDLQTLLRHIGHVIIFRQAARLFPSFWGPLLGRVMAARIAPRTPQGCSRTVILPGTERSLLLPEIEAALIDEGYTPLRVAPDDLNTRLPRILADERPTMLLSVNLQGLDAAGERFRLLQACGVPVALWCVDNPWHLLSALRTPWWRETLLCVTDASFIPALRAHGAQHVLHLPLAASPHHFATDDMNAQCPPAAHDATSGTPLQTILFVGRSGFPDKARFFAGCRVNDNDLAAARDLLDAADAPRQPDFHWWTERQGLTRLWPDKAVRTAGYGAESCALLRRIRYLETACDAGLTVVGDAAWRDHLPCLHDLRPPVDYYGTLPRLYRQARLTLNVTSLLLPAGLTQRHFDVWMAGGFCITDATPGLDIFPKRLAAEVSMPHPSALPALCRRLEDDPRLRDDLAAAWRTCITEAHTYSHRLRTLFAALDALGKT